MALAFGIGHWILVGDVWVLVFTALYIRRMDERFGVVFGPLALFVLESAFTQVAWRVYDVVHI